jgi:hypothetical protein
MLEAWSSPVARAPYAAKDALRVARERSRWLDRTVRRARLKAGKYGKRLTGHGQ